MASVTASAVARASVARVLSGCTSTATGSTALSGSTTPSSAARTGVPTTARSAPVYRCSSATTPAVSKACRDAGSARLSRVNAAVVAGATVAWTVSGVDGEPAGGIRSGRKPSRCQPGGNRLCQYAVSNGRRAASIFSSPRVLMSAPSAVGGGGEVEVDGRGRNRGTAAADQVTDRPGGCGGDRVDEVEQPRGERAYRLLLEQGRAVRPDRVPVPVDVVDLEVEVEHRESVQDVRRFDDPAQ